MDQKEDAWVMSGLLKLSDRAWIRMITRLFHVEYRDNEPLVKEWRKTALPAVCLTVGSGDRYEFRVRRLPWCIQIQAEALGSLYCHEKTALESAVQICDPAVGFREAANTEYATALEFSGREQVKLVCKTVTLTYSSASQIEKAGFLLFLPFLAGEPCGESATEEDPLKYFGIHDIVVTLNLSMKKGDLTIFDVQKLKQLCRQRIHWAILRDKRLHSLDAQVRVLSAFETDFGQMEEMLSGGVRITD